MKKIVTITILAGFIALTTAANAIDILPSKIDMSSFNYIGYNYKGKIRCEKMSFATKMKLKKDQATGKIKKAYLFDLGFNAKAYILDSRLLVSTSEEVCKTIFATDYPKFFNIVVEHIKAEDVPSSAKQYMSISGGKCNNVQNLSEDRFRTLLKSSQSIVKFSCV